MSSRTFPSTGEKPKFDPNAAYEAVQEGPGPKMSKPKFDPNKQYHAVDETPAAVTPQPKQEQPTFSIQLSEPKTAVPIGPKTKEFSFDKPYDELGIIKLGGQARDAHNKLQSELLGNDKLYETKIKEYRRDSYTIDKLRNDYKSQGMILSPQDEQKTLQKEKQKRYDLPVTQQDISDAKTGTILNEAGTRKFVKDLNNPEAQKHLYTIDKFNELSKDPNGQARVEKVKEVAKKIGKGEIVYDTEKKIAVKPIGLIGGIIEGTINKFKGDQEYDFYKNSPDRSVIMELEEERNNPDTDEPVKVPKGKASQFMKDVAEMPLSPIIAGTLGTVGGSFIGNPEIGPVAATALGAYENRKMQYRSTLKQVYNELRNQGKSELEAIQEARKQAETAQEIGTVVGAAQGYIGAKIGEVPIKGTAFSGSYQKAIGDFLKQNAKELGKMSLEGAAQGGLAAGGEVWKNILAKNIGIKRDIDEGAADQFWGNLYMSLGIGAAIKAGRGLTRANYRTILNGISKLPPEKISGILQDKVAAGEITQDAANETQKRIDEYKQKDSQIPPNVTEEARFKIQDNIDKLNELEAQKESTHKSLQEPIKDKIAKLEEENLALAKQTEQPPNKVESGLSKAKEKEAIETAEEFVAEGVLPEIYNESVKKDPIGFWKTIAQQVQNRDENWKPLENPVDEQSVRDQFGDTVVDYAKELFPAPEIKEAPKSVSVIKPGEIQRPEVTTISPAEVGAGKVPEERVGHVEVSEHGEDTKTAAGEENGIKGSKLSEKGRQEAQELGQYLKDSGKKKIITSEIERAQETGRVASEVSGLPVEYNKVLNTWNIGDYDGKPEGSFVEEAWVNKPNEAPNGGESFNDFTNRMEQAYQYVKSLPEDNHVVSHSKVMRALSALEKTDGKWTEETTKNFLTNKELTNAVQEPSTSSILQHTQEGTGIEGGERGGVESGEQGEGVTGTRPEEEGETPGAKKEVGGGGIPPQMFDLPFTPEEGDVNRLAHADTEKLYREMGMNERIPRATKTDIQLEEEADNLIRNGYDFNAKADEVINGESKSFTDAEQVAFAKMVGALKTKLNNIPIDDPAFDATQRQIEKLSRASDIAGSEEGAAFRARRMFVLNDETLSDFMMRAKQANKNALLTEEQKKEVKSKWDEFDAAKKEYEKKIAKLEGDLAKAKAEKKVKEVTSTTKKGKKTKVDYAKERKDIVAAMRADLLKVAKGGGGALSSVPGAAQLQAIAPHVMKLLKSFAEEGVTKLEDFVKKIHAEVKDYVDGISEKDIHDILAGEHNGKKSTRSELAERLYNVKKQAELINKLERLRAGVQPKSEKALRKRNQETEAIRKQIKELQKEEEQAGKFYGESDTAERKLDKLRDELDRIKDRRERIPPEKGSTEEKEMSAREKELRGEIDKAQEEWDKEKEAAKQSKKDYAKIESERNRQLKKVSELKDKLSQLQNGIKSKGASKGQKIDTPEIESLKSQVADAEKELNKTIATEKRVKELESELNRLKARQAKQPRQSSNRVLSAREEALKKQIEEEKKAWADEVRKTPEELALNALKSRHKKQAEEYERKIREGDFEKEAEAPPIVLDKEAQDAKDRYIEAKKNWELGLAKQEYENRSGWQKAADIGLGIMELRRAVSTAYDFSVAFRQALPVTINPLHWMETSRAFKEMFSQMYREKNLDRWWFDLEASPDYKEMLEDGLPVHSPNELRISKREEEFRTRLAEKIPGIKGSNRAASGYLNSMRVDMYRKMRKVMEDRGVTRQNNPEAYKELGKYIGNLTGSGNLLKMLEGKPSKTIGTVFFGARLMAAKFNLLNPYYYYKIPKEFRTAALLDLGLRVGMYTTIGTLMNAAGFSVSLDPKDSDFLKVKHGTTTYDITGGEAIYVRTFLRVMGAAWERITGDEKSSLKAAEKAGLSVTTFFRNKLAPTPSYGLDAFLGKTSWGEKFDPYDIARIYPMWIDDIREDWKQDKAASILLAGVPSIFGIGVMTKTPKGGSGGGAGATGHYKQSKTMQTKYKTSKTK